MKLALRYVAFAVLATIVNLGAQWVILTAAGAFGYEAKLAVIPALVAGTGAGLVLKYVLDKRYIFADPGAGLATHARQFSLYTVMGLATTAIFWGTELLFAYLSSDHRLIYLGGALGLAVGYVVKYRLDRRFVFDGATMMATAPR